MIRAPAGAFDFRQGAFEIGEIACVEDLKLQP